MNKSNSASKIKMKSFDDLFVQTKIWNRQMQMVVKSEKYL